MSASLDIFGIGAKEVSSSIAAETREFNRELRKNLRAATRVLKNEARSVAASKMRTDTGGLQRTIGSSVKGTGATAAGGAAEYVGRVGILGRTRGRKTGRFGILSYYGHLETGGPIVPKVKGRRALANASFRIDYARRHHLQPRTRDLRPVLTFAVVRGGAFGGWVSVAKVITPARPFLGPALENKGDRAVEIVGDAFGVFQG
jgi:hypothetical protein